MIYTPYAGRFSLRKEFFYNILPFLMIFIIGGIILLFTPDKNNNTIENDTSTQNNTME